MNRLALRLTALLKPKRSKGWRFFGEKYLIKWAFGQSTRRRFEKMIRLLVCLLLSYPISIELYWVYLSSKNIIQWFGLSGGDVKYVYYSILGHDWGRNLCKCVWRFSSPRNFLCCWLGRKIKQRDSKSSLALTEARNVSIFVFSESHFPSHFLLRDRYDI